MSICQSLTVSLHNFCLFATFSIVKVNNSSLADKLKMKLVDIFDNLVHNRYMEQFNYKASFKFKTVFYNTNYSYSCCSCAFENEFVDYIGEKGELNEDIYSKIVKSIEEGKCPHINERIPQEWKRDTCVSGLQVAIAAGSEFPNIKREDMIQTNSRSSAGILKLSSLSIAMNKKRNFIFAAKMNNYVHCLTSRPENRNVEKVSYFKALVLTEDPEWVRKVFRQTHKLETYHELERKTQRLENYERSLIEALRYTFDHRLNELTDVMLEYVKQQPELYYNIGNLICRSAIMYDKPNVLKQVLKDNYPTEKATRKQTEATSSDEESEHYLDWATFHICDVLNRPGCTPVLLELGLYEESTLGTIKPGDAYACLFTLLGNSFDNFNDEILAKLKQMPDVEKQAITLFSGRVYEFVDRSDLVKAVLDLGADIALVESTVFLRIVNEASLYNTQARETVKELINANPNLEKNGTVVPLEFSKDAELLIGSNKHRKSVTGTYQTDCKEHGRFGHKGDNFVLNFSAPFFTECGFPVTREKLEENLRKAVVHPSIHNYIKQYIEKNFDNPRTLMIQCRDLMRKHFKGKALHRYLENSDAPKSVKDFVLMKHLLQPLKQ